MWWNISLFILSWYSLYFFYVLLYLQHSSLYKCQYDLCSPCDLQHLPSTARQPARYFPSILTTNGLSHIGLSLSYWTIGLNNLTPTPLNGNITVHGVLVVKPKRSWKWGRRVFPSHHRVGTLPSQTDKEKKCFPGRFAFRGSAVVGWF